MDQSTLRALFPRACGLEEKQRNPARGISPEALDIHRVDAVHLTVGVLTFTLQHQ